MILLSYFGRAYKYHGLGNDFVLFDSIKSGRLIRPADAIRLCDRHFGVGADGILTLLPSRNGDFYMHIYNSDGSVAEMCGNGIRCAVKHFVDFYNKSKDKSEIRVETAKGIQICSYTGTRNGVESVLVNMGAPILEPSLVPVRSKGNEFKVKRGKNNLCRFAVSMGNPHFVIFGKFKDSDILTWGPFIEKHRLFPVRTNVEFATINNDRDVNLAVWERGVGITLACGSGSCATVVAGVKMGLIASDVFVKVKLPGGVLRVKYDIRLNTVFMNGPAERVFEIIF